jgi:hypothetical protein
VELQTRPTDVSAIALRAARAACYDAQQQVLNPDYLVMRWADMFRRMLPEKVQGVFDAAYAAARCELIEDVRAADAAADAALAAALWEHACAL